VGSSDWQTKRTVSKRLTGAAQVGVVERKQVVVRRRAFARRVNVTAGRRWFGMEEEGEAVMN